MEFNLEKLPTLPLSQYKQLPITSGVYLVVADEKIQYVGKALNINQRWKAHHRLLQISAKSKPQIYWINAEPNEIDALEKALIALLNPCLNNTPVLDSRERKIRIKKHQQPKIEQWSQALDITESRFIEDAITFYIRYLEGKQAVTPLTLNTSATPIERDYNPYSNNVADTVDEDNLDTFDGGIEL